MLHNGLVSHRLLPAHHALEEIGRFLPPRERLCMATLLRLPTLQAASFRGLRRVEFDVASKLGDIALLDLLWRYCRAHGLQPRYTERTIVRPCLEGNIEILRWWLRTSKDVVEQFASEGLLAVSRRGPLEVLDWWKLESGLPIRCSEEIFDYACMWSRVDVMQWWKDSGLELVYSHGAIQLAVLHGGLEVLRWWRESGLEVKLHGNTLRWAIMKGKADVLAFWLERNGYIQTPSL
ncbi:hypothetical protein DFJ73DRAFT_803828 [Zopfochytrium polystomum]|nr:hypothetical protein DFJ73DRAFT_803828 [Zopfochytrium polystomum]